MRRFTRDRIHGADESVRPAASADDELVSAAEDIVRHAWLGDLGELGRLAEERLRTAVADGVKAYEALQRAQRSRDPQRIVDAHVMFEAASCAAHARTVDRDCVRELNAAESAPRPEPVTATDGPAVARVPRLAEIIRRLRRLALRTTSPGGLPWRSRFGSNKS